MRSYTWVLAVVLLAGPSLAAGHLATLDLVTQKKLGVEVQPLASAQHSGAVTAYARVLDAAPLAAIDADLISAAAAAQASQSEAKRTRDLAAADATVSRRVAEAAAAQARADGAKMVLIRRRLGLEWGAAFATMDDGRRARLIDDLAAGRSALVRIDAPTSLTGAQTILLDLGALGTVPVRILGTARTSDPRLLSTGLIGVVSGPRVASLSGGLALPARVARGGAQNGVVVPRAALFRTAGQTFVYVRRDATHFERRAVVATAMQAEGLFTASGFRPGETVVIRGASALYAAETAPPAAARDKGE